MQRRLITRLLALVNFGATCRRTASNKTASGLGEPQVPQVPGRQRLRRSQPQPITVYAASGLGEPQAPPLPGRQRLRRSHSLVKLTASGLGEAQAPPLPGRQRLRRSHSLVKLNGLWPWCQAPPLPRRQSTACQSVRQLECTAVMIDFIL